MSQVLISVKFQGYYLELLIGRQQTVRDLVNAMKANSFIPPNISDQRLRYKKQNEQPITLDHQIQYLIDNQQNNVHYLLVEVIQQSQFNPLGQSQLRTSQIFQIQTNRILERIVRYLKDGSIDSLLRARQNNRIQSTMADHLAQIGAQFQKIQKQYLYFRKALQKIQHSKTQQQIDEQIKGVTQRFSDFLSDPDKNLIQDIKQIKKKFIKMNQKYEQQNQISESKIYESESEITLLKGQLEARQQVIQSLQEQVEDLKRKNDQSQVKIQELNQEISIKMEEINDLTEKLQNQQQQKVELQQKIEEQYEVKLQQSQSQLSNKNTQINQLRQNINDSQEQIQRLKSTSFNSPELQQLALIIQSQQQLNQNLINVKQGIQIPGNINEIIRNADHVKQLQSIIIKEMQLKHQKAGQTVKISKITQLMSYNKINNLGYSLNQHFHQYLNDKNSLLIIVRSDNNKFFGAFTEEKLCLEPNSYYFPDFEGCAFLFSLIQNNMIYYKIKQGQNSLVFDYQNLIIGNEDLMINFQENKCSSKFVQMRSSWFKDQPSNNSILSSSTSPLYFLSDSKDKLGNIVDSIKILQLKIYEVSFQFDKINLKNQ